MKNYLLETKDFVKKNKSTKQQFQTIQSNSYECLNQLFLIWKIFHHFITILFSVGIDKVKNSLPSSLFTKYQRLRGI